MVANNVTRTAFIQEHKDHVRHLTLFDQWLFVTTLRIPLTQLTSLRIHGHFNQPSGNTLPEEYPDVPHSLFNTVTLQFPRPLEFDRTRAYWQFIRNNPNLKRLKISTGALFGFRMVSSGQPTA